MKTPRILAKLGMNIFTSFILTLFLAVALSDHFEIVNPFEVAVKVTAVNVLAQFVLIMVGFKSNAPAFAYMALQQEIWIKEIKENLFPDDSFMKKATDHSMWVNYRTVHVPQAGAVPGVVQNRGVVPATVGGRVDTELTYNLNSYTTDPVLVQNFEQLQLSYDKRASVLKNIMSQLQFVVATQTLYAWAPSGAARIVRTSGSTSTGNLPHSTATGSRKMLTLADVTRAKKRLDDDNVPSSGRILLLNSAMYNNDLLNITNVIYADSFGSPNMPTGVVARLMGFDIMMRSDVVVYDNTGTPVIKAINGDGSITSPAATDNGAALAFHPDYVCHALGGIIPFYKEQDPTYYGDIFSAEVAHGSSKLRSDQKGIVAIVQEA